MRTLSTAATTQKNRRTGASFRRILEVRWSGETSSDDEDDSIAFYGDAPEQIPGGPLLRGKVRSWGPLTLQAEPGRIGGHQQVQIDLHDADHEILGRLFEQEDRPRTVRIWLWFAGTAWSDRVCLFAGVIGGQVNYNDATCIWQLTLKGAETLYDKTLGIEINRKAFPQINCTQCSGQIVPIVFGSNVRRIPTCPLGQPPKMMLTRPLGIIDQYVYLSRSVEDMGLEFETEYTITVGTPEQFETLVIIFHESDQGGATSGDTDGSSVAEILARGSTYAAGFTLGSYGEDGLAYLTIAEADLPEPDRNLMGFVIIVDCGADGWQSFIIEAWIDTGNGRAIVFEPENLDFTTGQLWKILSTPGTIPNWPTGTPVLAGQEWTFAVGHLPLESVDVVEVQGKPSNGSDQLRYYELAAEDYTVTLDNRSFNASLGRGEDDPGISTVSVNFAPSQWGGDSDTLFVTGTAEKTAPVEVLTELLTNPFLGGVDLDEFTVDSTGASSTIIPAFALTTPVKLLETVSDIAQQMGLLVFFDGDRICIRSIKPWGSLGSAVSTINEHNQAKDSFALRQLPGPSETNRLVVRFKPSCSSAREFRYTRESPDAIALYGERSRELNLWAVQDRTSAGDAGTFWLRHWLGKQWEAKLTGFLDSGLHAQPADTIAISRHRADNDAPITVASAVVSQLVHQPGDAQVQEMESVEFVTAFRLREWAIQAIDESDECAIDVDEEAIPAEGSTSSGGAGGGLPSPNDIGILPWDRSGGGGTTTVINNFLPSPFPGGSGPGTGGGGGTGSNYGSPRCCPGDTSADSGGSSDGSSGDSSGGSGGEGGCPTGDLSVSGSANGTLPDSGGGWAGTLPLTECDAEISLSIGCNGDGEWQLLYVAISWAPSGFESPTIDSFVVNDAHAPDISVEITSTHCGPLSLSIS